MGDRGSLTGWTREHLTGLLLGLVIFVGTVLRLVQADQSLGGDEVSTLWVVLNNGLRDTVSVVSGDAEITPPLNFILSWFAVRLGSAPELVRLPALLSGIVTIPLVFILGCKTIGERAGLVGAAVMALSPFMIFFSGNGRAYTLMILMLVASTITMLMADETGKKRWWVAYALFSCLAMYSHYTAFFVLGAQFVWLIAFRPESRLPGLVANVGAAILFLPWVSGLRSDLDSPTTRVLEALQGEGFEAKLDGVKGWAFGHPFLSPSMLPGRPTMVVLSIALLVALVLSARVLWIARSEAGRSDRESRSAALPGIKGGLVLILLIALAAPLGELLLSLIGTDLFGARNMTPSWYGFSLLIGALVTIPAGTAATVLTVVVLGGYGNAATGLMKSDNRVVNFEAPARVIDDESEPGDVVVDAVAALATPVTLTPLELHMENDLPLFSLNLPVSEPPFLASTIQVPPPEKEFQQAFDLARGNQLFLLVPDVITVEGPATSGKDLKRAQIDGYRFLLPENAVISEAETYDSYVPTVLYKIDVAE